MKGPRGMGTAVAVALAGLLATVAFASEPLCTVDPAELSASIAVVDIPAIIKPEHLEAARDGSNSDVLDADASGVLQPGERMYVQVPHSTLLEKCGDKGYSLDQDVSRGSSVVVELWQLGHEAEIVGSPNLTQRADPILAVARGAKPHLTMTGGGKLADVCPDLTIEGSVYQTGGMLTDLNAFYLQRPYQRIVVDAAYASADEASDDWWVSVYNVENVLKAPGTLTDWVLKVSCRGPDDEPSCPMVVSTFDPEKPCGEDGITTQDAGVCTPLVDPESEASALGAAISRHPPAYLGAGGGADSLASQGYCRCSADPHGGAPDWAFADVGCNVRMTAEGCRGGVMLPNNPTAVTNCASFRLSGRGWHHFVLPPVSLVKDSGSGAVEMLVVNLSVQDPAPSLVLFAKPVARGFEPFGLPTLYDYNQHADVAAYTGRQREHHVVVGPNEMPVAAEHGVYVSVFNASPVVGASEEYIITARTTSSRMDDPICPHDCFGPDRGLCQISVTEPGWQCVCNTNYGGQMCQGDEVVLHWDQTEWGMVAPGRWTYFKLGRNQPDKSNPTTIMIDFVSNGGHPVLIGAVNRYPGLTSAEHDKEFINVPHERPLRFIYDVGPADDAYLGLYNSDAENVVEVLEYEIMITYRKEAGWAINPYLSIIVGVVVSIVVCICLSACKRVATHRRRQRAAAAAQEAQVAGRQRPSGLPPTLIEEFPTYEWKAGSEDGETDAADEATCGLAGGVDDLDMEGPACTICICEYEPGETIRKLPCMHEFHQKCIDQWLQNHTSCPVCRTELLGLPGAPLRDPEAARSDPEAPSRAPPVATAVAVAGEGSSSGNARVLPTRDDVGSPGGSTSSRSRTLSVSASSPQTTERHFVEQVELVEMPASRLSSV